MGLVANVLRMVCELGGAAAADGTACTVSSDLLQKHGSRLLRDNIKLIDDKPKIL